VLGDELPAETLQPTRGCTPEELEKDILQETQALASRNTRIWQRNAFWVLEQGKCWTNGTILTFLLLLENWLIQVMFFL